MNPKRKQRLFLVIGGVVMVAVAIGLVLFANSQSISWFRTPTEIAQGDYQVDQVVRVGGLVKDGTVQRSEESLAVSFIITDGNSDVEVQYNKILPDLFREGQGIVAEGKVVGGVVVANTVLAKHDENYMPPEAAEALEKAGHPGGTAKNGNAGYQTSY